MFTYHFTFTASSAIDMLAATKLFVTHSEYTTEWESHFEKPNDNFELQGVKFVEIYDCINCNFLIHSETEEKLQKAVDWFYAQIDNYLMFYISEQYKEDRKISIDMINAMNRVLQSIIAQRGTMG